MLWVIRTEMMERTGVKFDLDMKTFTLGKLFTMQLNRFPDLVSQICNAAIQEVRLCWLIIV